ncbi:MAG: hypothetical protein EAZ82_07770 [Verrucomicrobia bacterium]|nr:MAG: hypothetical protein EAZ82_07770 [Verrucomicrobiota bacterium]
MYRYLKTTPGCPQSNWKWIGCTDLKEDEGLEFDEYETCEFCGQESIRYVHSLEHPDWQQTIRVGRICAARYTMTSPRELAAAEAILKNRSQRRQRFPTHKSWKTSAKGNRYIDYCETHILVTRVTNGYRLKIGDRWGSMTHPTEKEAMLKAFDKVTRKKLSKP